MVIVAPAGYGKTTLLAEWAAAYVPCAGWIRLDSSDNDPVRLWLHVFAALEQAVPGLARESQALLATGGVRAIDIALAVLVNALLRRGEDGEPIYLVLDDFHEIEVQAIHESLAYVAQYAPPTLRLILSGREELPATFARLMADGKVTMLPASALRFTEEESIAFLTAHITEPISTASMSLLTRAIEGWAACLRLATLALREGDVTPDALLGAFARGEHHVLSDYLGEEVLRRLPATVSDFLVKTSVLDRLCGPLCEAVVGDGVGQEMLDQLERMQLLLAPLDTERRWYRYHPLFAAFLRARLYVNEPGNVSSLHRRAAL